MLSKRTIRRHKRTNFITQIANGLKLGIHDLPPLNGTTILSSRINEESITNNELPSTSFEAYSSTYETSIGHFSKSNT